MQPTALKDYAEFIESFNEVKEATSENQLEIKKQEILDMFSELRKSFESNPLKPSDIVKKDEILSQFATLNSAIDKAKEDIDAKKTQMEE
jgi:hypothetical protein